MLTIHVNSFSYAKGIPAPRHDHGCGFVFDCRGIENSGLLPNLAPQTGLDTQVQSFLMGNTSMPDFLSAIETITEISVAKYLERGFTDLSINLGRTRPKTYIFSNKFQKNCQIPHNGFIRYR